MKGLHVLSEEDLRRVQLEELEILKYVKKVCDENNINYFLDWGTLLGAVRHKGFIPWDNDTDIGMLRKDYDRFCEVFAGNNDGYVLQNWYTDPNWPDSYSKVRKKDTVFITNYIENNQSNEMRGFDIDVFVYDNIPNDERVVKKLNKRVKFLQRLLFMKAGYRPWYSLDKISLIKRIVYIPYQLLSVFYKKERLVGLYEKEVQKYTDSGKVFCHAGTYNIQLFDKEVFSDTIELEFENEKFKCPKDYGDILKIQYGDYMTIPSDIVRNQRHYYSEVVFSLQK